MPYAVNLADLLTLTKFDPVMSWLICSNRGEAVEVEHGQTMAIGHAVRLDCDEEQAMAIVDVIRQQYPEKGIGNRKGYIRVYHSKTGEGNWSRV